MPKYALLLIDPQNDFIDPTGALSVPGAVEDTQRTISFIDDNLDTLEAIYVTLDYHQNEHIAHANWWINNEGQEPEPFTHISAQDIIEGKWQAKNAAHQAHSLDYLQKLEAQGKYQHTIWPKHCIQGTRGCEPPENLKAILKKWEDATGNKITYVHKGMSPMTEQFSALKAEVPQQDDPNTELNIALIKELETYEHIITAGQALSHCVANTVSDLINHMKVHKRGEPKKILLLRDCCSNVSGCNKMGEQFIKFGRSKGMGFIHSTVTLSSVSNALNTRRNFIGADTDLNPLLDEASDNDNRQDRKFCCFF